MLQKNSSSHNCILQIIVQGSFSSFHSRELHGHEGSAQWKTVDKRLWSPAYQFPLSALCCSFATFELNEHSVIKRGGFPPCCPFSGHNCRDEHLFPQFPRRTFVALIARMDVCCLHCKDEHLLPTLQGWKFVAYIAKMKQHCCPSSHFCELNLRTKDLG